MKLSKWLVLVLVLVPMMSMVSFKPVQSTDCSCAPVGYHDTDAVVLAAYQVWFGLDPHRCAFLPYKQPYNSSAREVIRRHIQEAKERGIDGFVVDWYGPQDDVTGVPGEERKFQDVATKILFEETVELQGFYVALMYDDQTAKYAEPGNPGNYESRVKSDLEYARDNYFTSPAYLEINGCPALFIFPDDKVKPYLSWEDIKAHLGVPVTLLDRNPNPDEPDYDLNFDGFYAWVQPTDGWDPEGRDWGRGYLEWFYETMRDPPYADKEVVGGVWPGFDDSLAPWSENRFMSRYQPGGMTHDLTLTLAEDNNVEYILVGTWNDFEEGTDIEYGVRMLVDMEKPDPEVLIRSTPVKVCWSSDIPSADLEIWMTYEFMNYEFIDKQPFSCGDYLSLTPGNLYELKLWAQIPPYSKWVKIRRIDPVPDEDPVVFETETLTVTSPSSGESWQVNSSQAITWTSPDTVGDVQIQFSRDNGCNWSTITPSTGNDGSFPWTLPNMDPSNKCLIRVSETDGVPSGTSAMFSIVPIPSMSGTITLNSPNGGESWLAGSTRVIKWNSTGDINNVTIYFSRNNGNTWKVISQNTFNDGRYYWVVPGRASDQCLIRVTANDSDLDPKPSDVSDTVFSVVVPSTPTLEVIAPNGGEQLTVGSRFTITWNAFNTREDVRIEYSVNGGDTWAEITGSTENNGKYDWTVPDERSDNCLVRISETGGQASDESDALFSIVSPSPGDITVTSPNGSENWETGSSQEIKWTTSGGIDGVKIEYSRDNGTTWKTIVQTTPNSHSFNWTVPDIASDECLVRITSNDASTDPIPSDISDAVFSIVPPASPAIKVITPNGGEQLPVGSQYDITWFSRETREAVRIELSVNGGDTWLEIIGSTENNGKYEWTVPDAPSEACLVRISETDGQPVDISDAVFSIVEPVPGEITVISPNGGETWTVGSIKEITWTAGGINNVTIEYSTDYGTTWKEIVQTTGNDGSYDWTVPDPVSDECLVRVSSNDGDPDPKPSDTSDRVFSIIPDLAGEFRVTSPNGGEKWEVGTVQAITWAGTGEISSVSIDYSTDNGNTWSTVVSSTGNSGTYDWTIPDTVSDECLVRITSADGGGDPGPSDVSDAVFSILQPSSPTIRVMTPNGGEQLVIGSIYGITWFSTDSRADVKIEYSINGGETWTEIINSTENDGDYDWTVPDEPSEICLVRISDLEGQPVDVSDAVFSIVQPLPGDLTVLTPNGGENLESGSEYNISWTCSGINNVIIEYSVNNGVTWLYIDKVPADNGSYTWTVPGAPSEMCLVRITGADSDENPSDVSDEVFTIFDPSQASIEVFTPNGGESLSVGEEYYITWASSGINNVFIEYSTTNGEEWISIDTVSAIGGRFTWTVPDTPSDSCLIRITGNDSPGDPSDVSDSVFSITSD